MQENYVKGCSPAQAGTTRCNGIELAVKESGTGRSGYWATQRTLKPLYLLLLFAGLTLELFRFRLYALLLLFAVLDQ